MIKIISNLLLIGILLFTQACSTQQTSSQNDAEGLGTFMGTLIGAAIGSQMGKGDGREASIMAGALVGAFIGNRIGHTMDEVDKMKLNQALETSQTNVSTRWENPDYQTSYEVTPTRTYYAEAEQPCREYTMNAFIDGRPEVVQGTACRNEQGEWVNQ